MTLRSTSTWLNVLLLLIALPAAAQLSGNAQIEVVVGQGESVEESFQLTSAVNCPRDSYKFLLSHDSDFVTLPVDTIELSRRGSSPVSVVFDSNGLEPGLYTANITVECIDCGRCAARDKSLRVAMTVTERGPGIEDDSIEPVAVVVEIDNTVAVPDLTGSRATEATERLIALDLQPVMEPAGIARIDLLTILEQQPAPAVVVPIGSRVSLVPGVPVPDVVGLGREEANLRLDELGLLLAIAGGFDAIEDSATVAAQDPAANVVVAIGTLVNLDFSGAGGAARTWLPAVAMLFISGIVILFWRLSSKTAAAPAARIDVRSQIDPGTQQVSPNISDRQKAVVRVRLTSDAGEQSVFGDAGSITGRKK